MTPRKELFVKIKNALKQIPELEYIDLFRNQYGIEKENYPDYFTAALIRVNGIRYETMTEHIQEGDCSIDVFFYCKDGWADQHSTTSDDDDGLIEIDILDKIVDQLQFLNGEQFKPLQQVDDQTETIDQDGIMSYRLSFSTYVYKRTEYPYQNKKLTITQL